MRRVASTSFPVRLCPFAPPFFPWSSAVGHEGQGEDGDIDLRRTKLLSRFAGIRDVSRGQRPSHHPCLRLYTLWVDLHGPPPSPPYAAVRGDLLPLRTQTRARCRSTVCSPCRPSSGSGTEVGPVVPSGSDNPETPETVKNDNFQLFYFLAQICY